MKAAIERVWWHGQGCGFELPAVEQPTACTRCGTDPARFEDLGYRVGFNGPTYSYYSTFEHARKDKRVA